MYNLNPILKYFLGGFIAAFMLLNLTQCPEEDSSKPSDETPAEETEELKAISEELISAFEAQDIDKIRSMMYENHVDLFTEDIEQNLDKFPAFTEALRNRKIIASAQHYAEYELTIDGETYTIAYAQSGNGNWRLLRF